MSWINKLKRIVLCGGAEDSEYKRIEKELQSTNRNIVRYFSLITAIALALMFLSSLAVASLSGNKKLYGIGLLLSVAIYIVATFPGKENRTLMLIDMYVFEAVLMCVGIVLGTVLGPKEISATYIALLLAAPQLFTDRPYRMYIIIAASAVAFIITALIVKDPSTWSSDITNAVLFSIISIILSTYSIATRVERYCLQERIRFLAENDQLTGLRNRYCYEQSLARASLLETSSIYCVYVDVNGLHELNNTKGHDAGDRMLQYIATVMQNLFGEDDTYRIGGDEFVALGVDREYKKIEELVASMKKAVEAAGYYIAVGISYREKKGIEIGSLIKEAEKEMYTDKALYYQKNGIDRRRKH